jgi:UDP-N-acetylmuramoyl-L-alanyl-D-glutamate--2,6-diaminopimelate ligase
VAGDLRVEPAEVDLRSVLEVVPGAVFAQQSPIESIPVRGLELDSRLVRPGQLFAALPGHRSHGVRFAEEALARGAVAILTDPEGLQRLRDLDLDRVPVLVMADPRGSLGVVSQLLYQDPGRDMVMLAVTGTNGKTTVAAMIQAGLTAAGWRVGTIGTVGITVGDRRYPVSRTTPEAPHLQAVLAAMREQRVDAVALEVSSHALCEHRVDSLAFEVAAFTNLSQDHLDYHGTMDEYFRAKASLFVRQRTKFAVIGIDDPWGRQLAQQVPVPSWTCSTTGLQADWRLLGDEGDWRIEGPQGERQALSIPLPGLFNLANAACAYAVLRRVGIPGEVIASGLAQVRVPGRMEPIGAGRVLGIVDYAHSPDAIERVVSSVRQQARGRILVVLGAGGDRDQGKRPLMGAAAARLADVVVITDDNPRSEDPASIRAAVLEGATSVTNGANGVAEVLEVPGRAEAIGEAVALARPGDVILLLGKGHEQGQEIGSAVLPFDDRQVLSQALNRSGIDGSGEVGSGEVGSGEVGDRP